MALASSIGVRHRCRLSSSTYMRAQNASTTALSKQSPTDPMEGMSPDWRARWVNAQFGVDARRSVGSSGLCSIVLDVFSRRVHVGDESREAAGGSGGSCRSARHGGSTKK